MLIDSHCHLDRLDLKAHGGSLDAALDAARAAGVKRFLNVSVDLESFPGLLEISRAYEDVWCSVGVHPGSHDGEEPTLERLLELAADPKVIALGETGLDYYYGKDNQDIQRERFRLHLRAARQCRKPVIVHTRDAREDTMRIIREESDPAVGGIMHCFTESWEMAEAAIEQNFMISFSGIVTFKNAVELKEVAKKVPLDQMLVETDSPYLAPVPYRGKPNEPRWVREVAAYIADLRGLTLEELAEITSANFERLFPVTAGRTRATEGQGAA